MPVLPNQIIIGPENAPLFSFTNAAIVSVTGDFAVALAGDELAIDQLVPTVQYEYLPITVIKPTDYDGIKSSDGYVLSGHYNSNIRALPYGTQVLYYSDGALAGKFYVENVERVAKNRYQINCISAIGLMDKQTHPGGVYTGQTFSTVLAGILGDGYDYTVSPDVANLTVFGWLPYGTKRSNLYQLIFAYNVNIVKSSAGGMLFTFLLDSEPTSVPDSRVFTAGKVKYATPASRVEVTEHTYEYISTVAAETLFDNTGGDAANHDVVTFQSAPIYAASLAATGSITIHESGVNHAIVSGTGTLTGKPYTHLTRIVAESNDNASTRIVTVKEATLVSPTVSENVARRLLAYYSSAKTLTSGIVLQGEKCGERLSISNAFGEQETAFLQRMSVRASSFLRAECELIADYTPTGQGSSYTAAVMLTGNGSWAVPAAVYQKQTPAIRVTLIGGGQGGTAGTSGTSGEDGGMESGGAGGTGGQGGSAGQGGKFLTLTLTLTDEQSITYSCGAGGASGGSGGNTTFGAYSSATGTASATGVLNLFDGVIYALPGAAGEAGADGGDGYPLASHPPFTDGDNGGDCGDYSGGRACSGAWGIGPRETIQIDQGGCGGGGASATANGGDASLRSTVYDQSHGGSGAPGGGGRVPTTYGSGGNGGHGGGGGGGGGHGNITYYAPDWSSAETQEYLVGVGGAGGQGGAGSAGAPGCVIVYY